MHADHDNPKDGSPRSPMNTLNLRTIAALILTTVLTTLLANSASADRIELRDGSVVNGNLVSVMEGSLKVETAFAGTIAIQQAQVRTLTTDAAVHLALVDGSELLGVLVATASGIAVQTPNGTQHTTAGEVSALWREGADSPAMIAARALAERAERRWAYETAVAVAGRSGVRDKFGANFGIKATLASAEDKLVLSGAAERAEDNGVETIDRHSAGIDYSTFITPDNGWYARTALEVDEIRALDLRSTSGFGFSRKLIKTSRQDLEFRAGVGYLHENYADSTRFSSTGLDLAFLHRHMFGNAKMTNTLTYTPAFEAFGNYRLLHESALEIPLATAFWKLKLGLINDYHSRPPDGVESLDTIYSTSLILSWH